jgi:hypothetical protein
VTGDGDLGQNKETPKMSKAKGSRKNNFAELALRFGSGLADPREQNHPEE